jgi:hypothetical protein
MSFTKKFNEALFLGLENAWSTAQMLLQSRDTLSDVSKSIEEWKQTNSMRIPRCAYCNRSDKFLFRCSRCKNVYYDSVECQRAHWSAHKKECKPASH